MTRTFTAPLLIGTTASGSDWIAYPDRHTIGAVATMVARIGKFGGLPTEEALALVGDTVAVKGFTPSETALLWRVLDSLCGLEVLTTVIIGTREQFARALDDLDADRAWASELARFNFLDDARRDREEAAIRDRVANLRRRIRAAL